MIEFFPNREVALVVGSWSIHWYGVLYVMALGVGWWLMPRLQKYRGLNLNTSKWLEVITGVALGVLVGGRLGFVLLYEPVYFWQHPVEIFYLWQGGMASHGGFIGVGVALWLVSKMQRVDFWRLLDVAIVPVAIGLSLGRIGNVINKEIFVTPWGQVLAVGKDLFIAVICSWYFRVGRGRPGTVAALFLIMYGLLRFIIEWVRGQEYAVVSGLTRGQWYTLPIIIVGIGLWFYLKKTNNETDA